jgi:CBS domain-containing protein
VCTPWRAADPDRSRRPWGIITAQDIAAAASEDLDITAGEAAGSEVVTVSSSGPLDHAATGHPSGILSTLDVVAVYAGGAVS